MSNVIKLTGVRLSFPSLFNRAEFDGVKGKFEATLLIPKEDKANVAAINNAIKALLKETGKKKPAADKLCVRDGDDVAYDGYAGHWSIKASNSKRPTVINRDKTPLTEDDAEKANLLYAGCYVNASIDLWYQDNKFGKRINANLRGVQFVNDGEPFGHGSLDATDDFDEVEGGETEADDDDSDNPLS